MIERSKNTHNNQLYLATICLLYEELTNAIKININKFIIVKKRLDSTYSTYVDILKTYYGKSINRYKAMIPPNIYIHIKNKYIFS
jgi:DNA relaxase NicK